MTNQPLELIPATWDDVQDCLFFRVTNGIFPPAWLFGASVLLASYDMDVADEDQHCDASRAHVGLSSVSR